jgi:hypothetical protein
MWMGEPILPRCANHPQWPGQLREVPGVPCRNYRRKPLGPEGDVRLIPLAEGSYAYVDAADYEWLSQWNWHTASGGYAARSVRGGQIFMHREITRAPKGKVVDHADGNKANNCRFNLRVCTRRENQGNMQKQHGAYSRFKGVSYSKERGKLFAQCDFGGNHRWLGSFDDELEAARAYDRAAVEACGEFARVNFPREWPPQRRAEAHAQWLEAKKKEGKKVGGTSGKKRTSRPRAGRATTKGTRARKSKTAKAKRTKKAKTRKAKRREVSPP